MNILLNGEPRQLESSTTVAQVLASLDLTGRRVAVELNGDIVPRSQHEATTLAEGDRMEVVHAIGGG